jgi:hypothetical protein
VGYLARLTEALSETYPAILRALGADRFYEVCELYIDSHDSLTGNLSDYGGAMADFLHQKFGSVMLRDLAHLEWKFKETFHAREEPGIDLSTVVIDGNSRMLFSVASALLFCTKGVYTFWDEMGEGNIEVSEGAPIEACFMFRTNLRIVCEIFDEREGRLLRSLRSGETLNESLGYLGDCDPSNIASFFKRLAATLTIVGVQQERL